MSAKYIISRGLDPIFAVSCGVIAAGVRINREEKEKGRTTEETIEAFKRRWALAFEKGGDVKGVGKQAG
ncbi:uncharacterized protein LTR77_002705 [Saxophila tyrrhenica]|uniref:Uncharacterized protein n=1 Tax=Saxophila tyrrhenica TaxID=1690608 RepID=A0AAV9PG82_9PEZI|nr:hypothetical protein LTR77_002705 [Saxophila tyrrhenica]